MALALVATACGAPSGPTIERGAQSARVSAPAPSPEPSPSPVRDTGARSGTAPRQALLIGIDHAPGASPLEGAVGDVRVLEEALLAYGIPADQVVVLEDREADRDRILDAIDELAAVTPPDGRAVFAFAGHTRRIGGRNHIVTADGRMISAGELAEALGRVRAPMWVALPTCYAAGFSVPGIVGPGRVTTFASAADQPSYESLEFERSFLFEYMVGRGMLAGRASGSVEQAYSYAHDALAREFSRHVPLIDDRFPGHLTLGPPIEAETPRAPGGHERAEPSETPGPHRPEPRPTPTPKDSGQDPTSGLPCTDELGVGACDPS